MEMRPTVIVGVNSDAPIDGRGARETIPLRALNSKEKR